MEENKPDNKSPHILNTSSNLLGLCFIVLTSLRLLNLQQKSIIDEVVSICALVFMTSSILSFLSMKAGIPKKAARYENLADYFFISGLGILFLVIVIITFDQVK